MNLLQTFVEDSRGKWYMRFYKITGGSATLDGREFSDLNVDSLRKQIGYVGQLPTLFNGTVRQNILLGKDDASEAEIVAACKAAHAHDFITTKTGKSAMNK